MSIQQRRSTKHAEEIQISRIRKHSHFSAKDFRTEQRCTLLAMLYANPIPFWDDPAND